MKDGNIGHRSVDIQYGAIHGIGEHNFPWLELAMTNQDGCSSSGCKHRS
jgi:hypothetical protein